jgi:hypothetical protein
MDAPLATLLTSGLLDPTSGLASRACFAVASLAGIVCAAAAWNERAIAQEMRRCPREGLTLQVRTTHILAACSLLLAVSLAESLLDLLARCSA